MDARVSLVFSNGFTVAHTFHMCCHYVLVCLFDWQLLVIVRCFPTELQFMPCVFITYVLRGWCISVCQLCVIIVCQSLLLSHFIYRILLLCVVCVCVTGVVACSMLGFLMDVQCCYHCSQLLCLFVFGWSGDLEYFMCVV